MKTVGEMIGEMRQFIEKRFDISILDHPTHLHVYNKKKNTKTTIKIYRLESIYLSDLQDNILDYDIKLVININKNLQIKIKNNILHSEIFMAEVTNTNTITQRDAIANSFFTQKLLCNLN